MTRGGDDDRDIIDTYFVAYPLTQSRQPFVVVSETREWAYNELLNQVNLLCDGIVLARNVRNEARGSCEETSGLLRIPCEIVESLANSLTLVLYSRVSVHVLEEFYDASNPLQKKYKTRID